MDFLEMKTLIDLAIHTMKSVVYSPRAIDKITKDQCELTLSYLLDAKTEMEDYIGRMMK